MIPAHRAGRDLKGPRFSVIGNLLQDQTNCSSARSMSDVHVTSHAAVQIDVPARSHRGSQRSMGRNRICHFGVATKAVALQHPGIRRHDANGLREVLQGESFGVPVAVTGLYVELVENVLLGQMTIVAGGMSVMGTLPPTIVMVAHDVAVHAGRWIV